MRSVSDERFAHSRSGGDTTWELDSWADGPIIEHLGDARGGDPDWARIMLDGPEAHGLDVCARRNGYGSSLKEEADRCTRCGGTGLVPVGSPRQQD